MKEIFNREKLLIGEEKVNKLNHSSVLVFGIGGVGSYTVEALARGGVGHIDIVDKDIVDITNINRQLIALTDTVGRPKVEVMKERILKINPDAECIAHQLFYLPEEKDRFDFEKYDYIIDCVDNVTAKLSIIQEAKKAGVPVISSMGTGNKLDPTAFKVADISKTSVCPLARIIRKELRQRGIEGVKVLYSEEESLTHPDGNGSNDRTPASISFVPSVAGLIIAGEVIRDLAGI